MFSKTAILLAAVAFGAAFMASDAAAQGRRHWGYRAFAPYPVLFYPYWRPGRPNYNAAAADGCWRYRRVLTPDGLSWQPFNVYRAPGSVRFY